MTGNVNSYARILNGPSQLEKIKSYNQLALSLAELQREKAARAKERSEEKKKAELEKAAKKVEKERVANEKKTKIFQSVRLWSTRDMIL